MFAQPPQQTYYHGGREVSQSESIEIASILNSNWRSKTMQLFIDFQNYQMKIKNDNYKIVSILLEFGNSEAQYYTFDAVNDNGLKYRVIIVTTNNITSILSMVLVDRNKKYERVVLPYKNAEGA